ncbi:GNAT family N-acetyltransferase [Moellerella wisconsensis]|nr:GNAT family protein [Moellerella wisconsensis]UNH25626.1 GNAT family N-acetyltransferase [Moellerella wisconsensis]UNH28758.1 GNAT family N-acetyltransferase [Moellerella wisconsensis]UNH42867.1 GNAT family N-acetyltransferase [Moellerella wisconsensis]WJW83277.1 GNAT family protein [Moellerella wisconsensis]
MITMTTPVVLEGKGVLLIPISHQYDFILSEIIRQGKLDQLWYTSVPAPANIAAEIDRRINLQAVGKMLSFIVINKNNQQIVGLTAYNTIDNQVRRVEIGATWYRLEAQRTHINTEAKYLLLKYAFEQLDCVAVEFRTHILNLQSRKAIERLGAKLDGILRSHSYTKTGELRDSCVYSIIASEWSVVKRHLEWQLTKPR